MRDADRESAWCEMWMERFAAGEHAGPAMTAEARMLGGTLHRFYRYYLRAGYTVVESWCKAFEDFKAMMAKWDSPPQIDPTHEPEAPSNEGTT